jgi:hypothetical protein
MARSLIPSRQNHTGYSLKDTSHDFAETGCRGEVSSLYPAGCMTVKFILLKE